ncbi:lysylphosphatidylglycerol synthase domain-containing protein [Puniceicoccus vermicola]|uniref:Flippase-like domain-containing protein n=1 Tax=Puniceicoccus vermicola TaxID=388746 RepID=A0A7X1E5Z3_9BACT|nr:lysylphosphatidylglycerol synthase domain-containing protein [Puniceicoccus vermicola]MBC2603573.1 flippase-like domain-containing protein [Puniceicoccus vermicola]
MKFWLRVLGSLLALGATIYFGWKFYESTREFPPGTLGGREIVQLGWILLFVPFQVAIGALAWRRILWLLGSIVSRTSAIRIVFISQIARYIPGNVGHLIGKVVMVRGMGISLPVATTSIIIESIILLLCGGIVAGIILPSSLIDYVQAEKGRLYWLILAVLLGVVLAGGVLVLFRRALRSWLLELRSRFTRESWFGLRSFVFLGSCYFLNFVFLGVTAWWIGWVLFPEGGLSILFCTGVMSLAWTVGFFTPGAPAGIGVREVVALAFLGPFIGEPEAILLLSSHRIILSLGDVVTFVLGWCVPKQSFSKGADCPQVPKT